METPATALARDAAPTVERIVGQHNWCMLYHADCNDVLPLQADAVVTDPPYGLGARMQGGTWGAKNKEMMVWDALPADVSGLLELAPLVAIWGGNYYPLPPSRGWLVWHKPDAVPTMANAELAWTNQDRNARQISWSIAATNAERVGHPTQKPVRVIGWTMEQIGVPIGATVLDPYMGSGTTGIACIRTGRNFIGIEKDAGHYKLAVERIRREMDGTLL